MTDFIYHALFLATIPQSPPQRVLHTVRATVSTLNF